VHEKQIEIRWRDMDAFGHVNNAAFLTYLEEVRDEFLDRALSPAGSSWDFVLVRVAIDYRRELTQADDIISTSCRLVSLGISSVTTREEVRTLDGELAAEAESVMVARDRDAGRSRPMTEVERAGLEGS